MSQRLSIDRRFGYICQRRAFQWRGIDRAVYYCHKTYCTSCILYFHDLCIEPDETYNWVAVFLRNELEVFETRKNCKFLAGKMHGRGTKRIRVWINTKTIYKIMTMIVIYLWQHSNSFPRIRPIYKFVPIVPSFIIYKIFGPSLSFSWNVLRIKPILGIYRRPTFRVKYCRIRRDLDLFGEISLAYWRDLELFNTIYTRSRS